MRHVICSRRIPVARSRVSIPNLPDSGLALYARDTQLCKAMNMRKEVWPSQLGPNVIGHNAAISACEKAQQWEHAINLSQEIWRFRIEPIVIGYSAAISACEKVQRNMP